MRFFLFCWRGGEGGNIVMACVILAWTVLNLLGLPSRIGGSESDWIGSFSSPL